MPRLFIGNDPPLEAVFEDTGSTWCSVITHPHSLMGGSMHNNVVMAAWKASAELGMSALRFNFRGVGASGGAFDNGNGEMDDLASAIFFVARPVIVIGYSFGAWVAARYLRRAQERHPAILVSPPNTMFEFPDIQDLPVRVVTGGMDPFCDEGGLAGIAGSGRTTVVPHADHFWSGSEDALVAILRSQAGILTGMGD